jgi:site-specific DNA recombinase
LQYELRIAEVVFLSRPIGGTAEDDLPLQVQGVIAEYERAKILERSRHAARSGSVSALTGAPFGYRYVSRVQGGGVARFEVEEDEAHIVRLVFSWIGLDRLSLPEVCRRLHHMGCRTRRGSTYWCASGSRLRMDKASQYRRWPNAHSLGRSKPSPRQGLRELRRHPPPATVAAIQLGIRHFART